MINLKRKHLVYVFCLFIVLPSLVRGECTCEPEDEDRNKSLPLKYKLVAFGSILLAGAIGVSFPQLGKIIPALSPEKNIFFMIKAFAAGVILATGFIHVLPEATESLTSPCLNENPWRMFPFAGLVAMASAIVTMMIDVFATSHFSKSHYYSNKMVSQIDNADEENAGEHEHENNHVHVHTHATHGHSHGPISSFRGSGSTELLRHRVISQVLEIGIVVHSVVIGISLGASESPNTVKSLVVALTFHQLFEGMGLGGCISQAQFKRWTVALMAIFFSLTTPVGIAVGIGISNIYDENSPTALIVEGILNSASAGILIYMSLVDLLAADFMNPKLQNSGGLVIGASLFLILGAGLMSLLALWA